MKAVILAGGYGTRLSEETHLKPKPMIEIGDRPILWHIMKLYSAYGVHDFIVCCGYKGYVIKEYFANYFLHMSDVTFDMQMNEMQVHHRHAEPWRVTLIDTGEKTLTGGRLKRVKDYISNEAFCFTYGDGVSDIDIGRLINHHQKGGLWATVTAVQPPGRYGALNINHEGLVMNFLEKPEGEGGWINGGFFILEPQVLNLIEGDSSSWESDTLPLIANKNQLGAFYHHGFWHPMDTLRDKNMLEDLWRSGQAPWRVW
ncbi:glucose-1-phosphate cytidylyltransferase [Cylindrospermopsis raciborskii]|uniref:glucose-1-phosphate cytidylyltransferase n=1 Tax=Cylindrospermopsis raciborskii TaxID=77022 RepID=UPI003DA4446E